MSIACFRSEVHERLDMIRGHRRVIVLWWWKRKVSGKKPNVQAWSSTRCVVRLIVSQPWPWCDPAQRPTIIRNFSPRDFTNGSVTRRMCGLDGDSAVAFHEACQLHASQLDGSDMERIGRQFRRGAPVKFPAGTV